MADRTLSSWPLIRQPWSLPRGPYVQHLRAVRHLTWLVAQGGDPAATLEAIDNHLDRIARGTATHREVTVDSLTPGDLGSWVVLPTRGVSGYLYGIGDDYGDGYPARTLTLVTSEAGDVTALDFSDAVPSGYAKTMGTPVRVLEEKP